MKSFLSRIVLPLLMATAACHAHATPYASNLIVNGTAEAGTTGWNAYDGTALIQATPYTNYPGVFLYPDAPRGGTMFTGGNDVFAAGWQMVDVSDLASAIHTGRVSFNLDGYLGGLGDQEDNTLLYVSFLDATGSEIDHTELGPNYVDLRDYLTVLGGFHTSGYLPVDTASIVFALSMEGTDGDSSGAFADNLSFTLTAAANTVPEPGSYLLVLLALGALTAVRRRAN